jgi:hypothetical protein
MDAGIGETMLIGAALGGGTSALMGKNPLMGAGIGALGGALAPGIGGMFGDAAAATVPEVASTAGNIGSSIMAQSPGLTAPLTTAADSVFPNTIATDGIDSTLSSATGNLSQAGSSIANPAYQGLNTASASNAGAAGASGAGNGGMFTGIGNWISQHPMMTAGGVGLGALMLNQQSQYKPPGQPDYTGPLSKYSFNPNMYQPSVAPNYGRPYGMAQGGITGLGGANMFPGSQQDNTQFNVPSQMPNSAMQNSAMRADYDPETNPYTGDISQNMASGGITNLGHYSDGGHLLKGPGDGMSDDIPARIGKHQEARLADGEFVVPADVVSHLGNGSTDAGAKRLYGMMNKVRKARTGNPKQGKQIEADHYIPGFADGGSINNPYSAGFGGNSPQYSYQDLMAQLRANPAQFKPISPVNPNNQQMGIQSLTNNAAIAQGQAQAQQPLYDPVRDASYYGSGGGG